MYLRRHTRKRDGVRYESWTVVESVRTLQGPRQRIVATLGKLPGMENEERVGWEEIVRVLDGKPLQEEGLFETLDETPQWATVNVKGVRVERLRCFGDVYLGLVLWKRLGLAEFWESYLPQGKEEIAWSVMACILTLARFCAPSSELQIAEHWYGTTALGDLLGVPSEKINDDRLYRALDAVLPHKDALCQHLQQRYGELFGAHFDFLLYDITSTYFEGNGTANTQAKRGYSRDGRPDCVQVCVGIVASLDGLPLAFEVFDGNRVDSTTIEEIVETMETKYGQAHRVWVVDRGMVSEDHLEAMRARKAYYLVGTPRSMLKKVEQKLLESSWDEVQPGVEVQTCASPDGSEERFIACRSRGRVEKDKAILNRFVTRLETSLTKLRQQAAAGKLRDRQKAERRIGRLLERHSRAASLFEIRVEEAGSGKDTRLNIQITKQEDRYQWAVKTCGWYLLRTNWSESDPKKLWKTYVQLSQVEDAFRITKNDLGMRPIYHQKKDRTQAHIFVCFLALVMWRTLQQWMSAAGLGTAPRKLLEQLRDIRLVDVILPTRDKEITLRVVTTVPLALRILLQRLKLPIPTKPKIIENVVQTFGI